MDKAWTTPPAPRHARLPTATDIPVDDGRRVQCRASLSMSTGWMVAKAFRALCASIRLVSRPGQLPGTSAGSTSPMRRQPFDSSHVRGAATSGGRSASA